MNYEQDLAIDKHNLLEECAGHAQRHFEYGKAHADALYHRRQAEMDADAELAKAEERIRTKIAAEGTKITDTAIKRMAEVDPEYCKAAKKLLDAAHDVNVLSAALDSLNARTRMLGKTVELVLSHWQAEPQISASVKERIDVQIRDELDSDLGKDYPHPAKPKTPRRKPNPVS